MKRRFPTKRYSKVAGGSGERQLHKQRTDFRIRVKVVEETADVCERVVVTGGATIPEPPKYGVDVSESDGRESL